MGKPSRMRDLVGAVLLVLVGLLYLSGVSQRPAERGHGMDGGAVDVMGVSHPAAPAPGVELST